MTTQWNGSWQQKGRGTCQTGCHSSELRRSSFSCPVAERPRNLRPHRWLLRGSPLYRRWNPVTLWVNTCSLWHCNSFAIFWILNTVQKHTAVAHRQALSHVSASTLISSLEQQSKHRAHAWTPSDASGRMTHVSPSSGSLASPGCVTLLSVVKYIWYEPFSDSADSSAGRLVLPQTTLTLWECGSPPGLVMVTARQAYMFSMRETNVP